MKLFLCTLNPILVFLRSNLNTAISHRRHQILAPVNPGARIVLSHVRSSSESPTSKITQTRALFFCSSKDDHQPLRPHNNVKMPTRLTKTRKHRGHVSAGHGRSMYLLSIISPALHPTSSV